MNFWIAFFVSFPFPMEKCFFDYSQGSVSTLSHSIVERPLPSTTPATKQKFSHQKSRRGGGLVLEYAYDLERVGVGSSGVIDEIKAVVERIEEKDHNCV